MTVSIMDGHTGSAHVTSDDWEAVNVALYEQRKGVLPWGDRFACHMSDANHAVVSSGAGVVCGRRFVIHELDTVEVESGTQGEMRSDIIAARYSMDDSGVESVSLVAIRGEPGATAQDPEVPEDDLPLWRIPLSGLNVGTPEKAYIGTLPSLGSAGGGGTSGAAEAAYAAAREAAAAAAEARAAAARQGNAGGEAGPAGSVDQLARQLVSVTGSWLYVGGAAYGPAGKGQLVGGVLQLGSSSVGGSTLTLG